MERGLWISLVFEGEDSMIFKQVFIPLFKGGEGVGIVEIGFCDCGKGSGSV